MLKLPAHFRSEALRLSAAGIDDWPAIAALSDAQLRGLAASGSASEQRLRRLRGQARLVVELELAPAEAALLLHGGIATGQALAEATPERLLVQLGRLERSLLGQGATGLTRATVLGWIQRARRITGRPGN
ncbi:DUF4332 domain-containing protein [Cyanobium sp. Morenito 9A2]|uniref:DUF4332 domain-containing protein n=1 Tax=Cyanobium sp. Morenito 9A2 TaxID=2823718 RepID=UPI0020CF7150|nr:DUF4332 domain-containing protein [Cyanobium sp. Morenito 9A2]MCP9849379.1 DUF4332 domain-containing protein [Cyanobium sp. Morenito 9A2]